MSLNHFDAPSGTYTSRIPAGMAAFRKAISEHFGYTRSEIVRDASRCRQTRSEHCECGACDFFTTNIAKGRLLFDWSVEVADALGIQDVIFNRRVIGFGNPRERYYSGPSPHTDHVHIGLNRWARANLTEAMVRGLLPGGEDDEMKPEDWQRLESFVHKEIGMLAAALLEKDNEKAQAGGSYFDTPRGESVMDVAVSARNHARKAAENTATPPAPPAPPIDAGDPATSEPTPPSS